MRTLILTVIMILGLSFPVNACIGSRAAGMGYAGVACINDSTAVYWNPALLSEVPNGFQFQHDVTPQIDSFNGDYIIPRLAMSFSFKQNNIGFCYVENLGREYYILGTGFKLADKLSFGACLDADSKYGRNFVLSADYSVNYRLNDNWNLAILCQSFSNYRPSISFSADKTTICLEFYDCFNSVSSQHLRIGAEQKIRNLILRCGANNYKPYLKNTDITIYYGLSYKFNDIEISIGKIQSDSYSMGININL